MAILDVRMSELKYIQSEDSFFMMQPFHASKALSDKHDEIYED
ncbi:MAG TPA: hypothetical protein VIO11_00100 [Candidatus Methanoperedens sp.]